MCTRKTIWKSGVWVIPLVLLVYAYGGEAAEGNSASGGTPPSLEPPPPFENIRTMEEVWFDTFTVLNERQDTIASELELARIITPNVVLSYDLQVGYIGFLQRQRLELPHPGEVPDFCPPIVPRYRCLTPLPGMEDYCACWYGHDIGACVRVMDAQDEEDKLSPIWASLPTCEELRASYVQALRCIVAILEKDELTEEDMQQVQELQAQADKYWDEYVKCGCKDGETSK
jgi:hypothetical protein